MGGPQAIRSCAVASGCSPRARLALPKRPTPTNRPPRPPQAPGAGLGAQRPFKRPAPQDPTAALDARFFGDTAAPQAPNADWFLFCAVSWLLLFWGHMLWLLAPYWVVDGTFTLPLGLFAVCQGIPGQNSPSAGSRKSSGLNAAPRRPGGLEGPYHISTAGAAATAGALGVEGKPAPISVQN